MISPGEDLPTGLAPSFAGGLPAYKKKRPLAEPLGYLSFLGSFDSFRILSVSLSCLASDCASCLRFARSASAITPMN